jgi:hypothetical protein
VAQLTLGIKYNEWDSQKLLTLPGHLDVSYCRFDERDFETVLGEDSYTAPCLALASYNRTFIGRDGEVSEAIGVYLLLSEITTPNGHHRTFKRMGVGYWDATPGKDNPFKEVESTTVELV